ncbi:MAG: hypothetical protein M1825_004902 [Sarcosagium campestre]|nr:MAG: hypothetical protein M1825_004902 [Sarcosagium campestre]
MKYLAVLSLLSALALASPHGPLDKRQVDTRVFSATMSDGNGPVPFSNGGSLGKRQEVDTRVFTATMSDGNGPVSFSNGGSITKRQTGGTGVFDATMSDGNGPVPFSDGGAAGAAVKRNASPQPLSLTGDGVLSK